MKYAFFTFSFLILLALLYAYPLSKRLELTHIRLIIMGFLTAVGHPLTTLGAVLSLVALVVIYAIWPSMLFFFSTSGLAWVMTKAVSHVLEKAEEKQMT